MFPFHPFFFFSFHLRPFFLLSQGWVHWFCNPTAPSFFLFISFLIVFTIIPFSFGISLINPFFFSFYKKLSSCRVPEVSRHVLAMTPMCKKKKKNYSDTLGTPMQKYPRSVYIQYMSDTDTLRFFKYLCFLDKTYVCATP